MTPDPSFKVTVVLKGDLAIQLTTPLLLRKPCKLFASVARVCQRQLGFLVPVGINAQLGCNYCGVSTVSLYDVGAISKQLAWSVFYHSLIQLELD